MTLQELSQNVPIMLIGTFGIVALGWLLLLIWYFCQIKKKDPSTPILNALWGAFLVASTAAYFSER